MINNRYHMKSEYLIILVISIIWGKMPDKLLAPIHPVTDNYHGVEIIDPYRYMENLDLPEVQDWIKLQAEYSSAELNKLKHKEAFLTRLLELDMGKEYRVYNIKRMKDESLFYLKIKSNENLPKLYYRSHLTAIEKLIIDPEEMSEGKTQHYSLEFYQPSPNGRFVVYGIAEGGSEQTIIHVYDMINNQDTGDVIDRIETAYNIPQWWNEQGFFYCRRQKLDENEPVTEIYKNTMTLYHELGELVENDKPIFGRSLSSNVEMLDVDFPSIRVWENSNYIIGKIKHGDSSELTLYTTLKDQIFENQVNWKMVCDVPDSVVSFTQFGEDIYLFSAYKAPRYKVVRTKMDQPDFTNAEVIFPPAELVYRYASRTKDRLYFSALDGGYNRLIEYDPITGNLHRLDLPENESAYIISSNTNHTDIFLRSASWIHAGRMQVYDHEESTFEVLNLEPPGKFDNPEGLTSERVMITSHDGVQVPLSIIYQKNLQHTGKNPTILSGYGSYGSAQSVYYRASRMAWLEKGGIIAIAHVRGGGEYGKEWHLMGQKSNKPNTWKDFISCAEYLIDKGYTSEQYLAGQGGSAGGILIGRAITERPDLFQCAIINVGCMDMLRMETTTNGVPNIKEFGSVKTREGFDALLAMSSFHHVVDGVDYPAVLSTHGVNDPRVEPWFSAKMTARLQTATSGNRPILFRVDYDAGHGIGSTKMQRYEKQADIWAFLLWQFGQ